MSAMSEELKPCPFCHSEAKMQSAVRWIKPRSYKRRARGVYWCVGCSDPDCILYLDGKAKQARLMFTSTSKRLIIRRWNRRMQP